MKLYDNMTRCDFVHNFMIEICFMEICYLASDSVGCHDKLIDISNKLFHQIDQHCNSNAEDLDKICQTNKPISCWCPLA